VINAHNDINFLLFVLPGLTKPAPYLIRGNPVYKIMVPCFRRDDAWIPASAGMTCFAVINDAVYNKLFLFLCYKIGKTAEKVEIF